MRPQRMREAAMPWHLCTAAASRARRDRTSIIRPGFLMGFSEEQFAYPLNAGEEFQSPEVIMSYSGEGLAKLSQNCTAA